MTGVLGLGDFAGVDLKSIAGWGSTARDVGPARFHYASG